MQKSIKKYHDFLPKCFKALSNPVRMDVFLTILENSNGCPDEDGVTNCVTHIAKQLKLPQPTVSNHVKELSICSLVEMERKGRKVLLSISQKQAELFQEFANFVVEKTM